MHWTERICLWEGGWGTSIKALLSCQRNFISSWSGKRETWLTCERSQQHLFDKRSKSKFLSPASSTWTCFYAKWIFLQCHLNDRTKPLRKQKPTWQNTITHVGKWQSRKDDDPQWRHTMMDTIVHGYIACQNSWTKRTEVQCNGGFAAGLMSRRVVEGRSLTLGWTIGKKRSQKLLWKGKIKRWNRSIWYSRGEWTVNMVFFL